MYMELWEKGLYNLINLTPLPKKTKNNVRRQKKYFSDIVFWKIFFKRILQLKDNAGWLHNFVNIPTTTELHTLKE